MNFIGAFTLLVLISLVLGASRRVAFLGMIAGVMYLTQDQQIRVLGLNLFALRFLELAGFLRVMARREFSFHQLNKIDHALLWLYGYMTVVFLLRSPDGQVYQIGLAVDAFLCYFTFRGLMAGMDDFRWFLRALVFLLAPYTLFVVMESLTGHNPFTVMGGVEGGDNWTRHGWPRCFGSFRQPDTLGMFAASFIPLYVGLACIIKERKLALLAICLCLIIALAANSGGAASAVGVGLLGWLFWRLRTEMRKVRWGIVAMIAALALVMKAPIWYIFARASSITGGDGWHRSYLIDVSFKHLGQWWFAGMSLVDTKDWFPYINNVTSSADITNFYIASGLTAGVGAIGLIIFVLTRAFSNLGKALVFVRSSFSGTCDAEFLLWGFGVTLAVHIVNWFGIEYFDQMYVIWFMQLAAVSTLSYRCLKDEVSARPEAAVDETMDIPGHQPEIVVENLH